MTVHHLADPRPIDDVPTHRMLEGLSRLYRWIVVTDSSRRLLWTSEAFSDLVSENELEVGDDARGYLPKLPRPEQVFSLRSDLRNRRNLSDLTLDIRTRDGSVQHAEVHLLKIESAEGDPLLLAIARPVQAEVEAPERGVSDAIVSASPTPTVTVDREGFVVQANAAAGRLLGRAPEEVVSTPAALLFGDDADTIERVTKSLFDGLAGGSCEASLPVVDGAARRLHVEARSLTPTFEGVALFLRDVAEASEIESELRRANSELEHCVNALAHDLRSPLVALLGFSRLLRQDYDETLDDAGHHFLDRIEQAGRTMEGLIHDLLELSRIGQRGEHPSLVDPRAVLVQLKAELKSRLEERGIDLVLPDLPPPMIYCDRTRLYQVCSNLIGNAIEHMGDVDEGRVTVEIIEHDDAHELVVRDNGQGIAGEHLEKIFEVFQSVGRRGRNGAGIGLAIVRKIAETHGGNAWAESQPGAGAAFHVRFPRR
jgi:PAS domain S-box-containing protein